MVTACSFYCVMDIKEIVVPENIDWKMVIKEAMKYDKIHDNNTYGKSGKFTLQKDLELMWLKYLRTIENSK